MPFLWKILQRLAARKLVRSFRGVRGGYELAKPSQRITIESILKEMGEGQALEECILGFPRCRDKTPCALHTLWADHRESLKHALRTTTLADLSSSGRHRSSK